MPIREYAPLCLTRAFAGGRPKRLGAESTPSRPRLIQDRADVKNFLDQNRNLRASVGTVLSFLGT
jgi:hypothetical protein